MMNRRRRHSRGFTLVELLVAMAIFITLLAGIVVLFSGSLRAVRTGNQNIDIQEEARGALAILKEDLMTAFSSVAHSDSNTFYGTPIGMTFVGLTQNKTNQARITYVIYSDKTNFSQFPTVESDDPPRYSRMLLRYEEPNVGDLESFPVNWEAIFTVSETTKNLKQAIGDAVDAIEADLDLLGIVLSQPCKDRIAAAKRREIWIRMLAGGDRDVPNAWNTYDTDGNLVPGVLNAFAEDYALSENVVSDSSPLDRFVPSGAPVNRLLHYPADDDILFDQTATQQFFVYDCAQTNVLENPAALNKRWWNDARRTADLGVDPTQYCLYYAQTRLPEVVRANLMFMKESPHPSAPDLQRRFDLEVLLPAGYRRSTP